MLLFTLAFAYATPPVRPAWFSDQNMAALPLVDRQSDAFAIHILTGCEPEGARLQVALTEGFRRDRDFILAREAPSETAACYIYEASAQVEPRARAGRKN